MMRKIYMLTLILAALWGCISCSSSNSTNESTYILKASATEIHAGYEASSVTVSVESEREWGAFSDEGWIKCTVNGSTQKSGTVEISLTDNAGTNERTGSVTIKSGTARHYIAVTQEAKPVDNSIVAPEGYTLVWNDEFDRGDRPNEELWWYETGGSGWGNNELQNYVACTQGSEQLATVKDGIFSITAKKIDGTVYSIRINTQQSWKYGYFEARLRLPSGKGTWPAFWMMPANFTAWPGDGEIDIMEEVGYNPNYVSSAIHCNAYNHMNNTQKNKETYLATAQSEFHVYALEWTEDYIRTYVDGKELLYFANDKKGNKDTWPFNAAFYLKLNLAWGGNWGGAQGVDESALPATYEIDYVRVFQKK